MSARPIVLPAQLGSEGLPGLELYGIVVNAALEVQIVVSVRIRECAEPGGFGSISCGIYPCRAAANGRIHASERAKTEWRGAVAGAVPSPADRRIDDIHILRDQPVDGGADVAFRLWIGDVERCVRGNVKQGFG